MPAGRRVHRVPSSTRSNARPFVTAAVDILNGDSDPPATVVNEDSGPRHRRCHRSRRRSAYRASWRSRLSDAEIRRSLESPLTSSRRYPGRSDEQARPRLGQAYSGGLDPRETLDVYLKETLDVYLKGP